MDTTIDVHKGVQTKQPLNLGVCLERLDTALSETIHTKDRLKDITTHLISKGVLDTSDLNESANTPNPEKVGVLPDMEEKIDRILQNFSSINGSIDRLERYLSV